MVGSGLVSLDKFSIGSEGAYAEVKAEHSTLLQAFNHLK